MTRAYHLSREQMLEFVRTRPHLVLAALDVAGQEVAALCNQIEDLALYRTRARLAHELARQALLDSERRVFATQADLAARIGSSPTEVARELSYFRRQGWVISRPHCHGIVVVEPDLLASYGM